MFQALHTLSKTIIMHTLSLACLPNLIWNEDPPVVQNRHFQIYMHGGLRKIMKKLIMCVCSRWSGLTGCMRHVLWSHSQINVPHSFAELCTLSLQPSFMHHKGNNRLLYNWNRFGELELKFNCDVHFEASEAMSYWASRCMLFENPACMDISMLQEVPELKCSLNN